MEEKYLTHNALELAADDTFIRWVFHAENDAHWTTWLSAHPQYQATVEAARSLVQSFSLAVPAGLTSAEQKEVWSRIESSIQTASRPKTTSSLTSRITWGLAAAASLALLIWYNDVTFSDKIFARAGEQKEVILPEKSTVALSAGSLVTYKGGTYAYDRTVLLEGEGFFHVTPGTTFTVRTDFGSVTVLGTSFNVLARDRRFEVTCFTGKVRVETHNDHEMILEAGQASRLDPDHTELIRDTISTAQTQPEWMSGVFRFQDQPLWVVAAELERQYNIRVRLAKELKDLRYTGLFESGDLEKALQLITWPLHLTATVKGNNVILTR